MIEVGDPRADVEMHEAASSRPKPWSEQEDTMLNKIVEQFKPRMSRGSVEWNNIAKSLHRSGYPGRSASQCRQRWHERAGPASSTLQQQPVHVPVVPTALPQLPPVKTRAPQGTPRVAAAPRDLVPLSHVHAVLPGMLLQVVHMASQRGYPKDVIDFMHNCMVASTPNLIQYLDNALQPSIRCVQQQCDDSKRCSRPYSSATPRGGETPVQPRAAVLKHSSTLARSVSGSPGLIGTTLTPTRGIPQASSWGVGEDGQPRLVRMTVGQLLHGQQLVERLDDDHC